MKKDGFKYLFALLLFGSNGIVASHIALTSYEIVFLRTMIGGVLLLAVFLLTKGRFTFLRHRRQFGFLAVSGIAMGVSWMFLYEAYRQVGVSVASLAYYCGPVLVMALSPLLFQEKLTAPRTAGFLIVLVGVFLVNGQAVQRGAVGWGLFCGGMSAVMYALMVVFNKKAKNIKGLENSMLQLVVSFLTVAVFVGLKQGIVGPVSSSGVVWILILGLFNTGVGCYLYFSSIGALPVQTVAVLGYVEPLSAVILAAVLLRETMTGPQILGAGMIIGGAIFCETAAGKRQA